MTNHVKRKAENVIFFPVSGSRLTHHLSRFIVVSRLG